LVGITTNNSALSNHTSPGQPHACRRPWLLLDWPNNWPNAVDSYLHSAAKKEHQQQNKGYRSTSHPIVERGSSSEIGTAAISIISWTGSTLRCPPQHDRCVDRPTDAAETLILNDCSQPHARTGAITGHALRSGLWKTWSSVCRRFSAIARRAQVLQAVTCAEKLPGGHIITTEFAAAEQLLPTKRRKLKLTTCVLG
jgi:hypothetical protein